MVWLTETAGVDKNKFFRGHQPSYLLKGQKYMPASGSFCFMMVAELI